LSRKFVFSAWTIVRTLSARQVTLNDAGAIHRAVISEDGKSMGWAHTYENNGNTTRIILLPRVHFHPGGWFRGGRRSPNSLAPPIALGAQSTWGLLWLVTVARTSADVIFVICAERALPLRPLGHFFIPVIYFAKPTWCYWGNPSSPCTSIVINTQFCLGGRPRAATPESPLLSWCTSTSIMEVDTRFIWKPR